MYLRMYLYVCTVYTQERPKKCSNIMVLEEQHLILALKVWKKYLFQYNFRKQILKSRQLYCGTVLVFAVKTCLHSVNFKHP